MTLQQVINFEKPLFNENILEVNRILASEIFFKIDMNQNEFWKYFLEYIFKNIITKEFKIESIKVGKIIQIKNDNDLIKSYIITKYELESVLELATFQDNKLIKINIKTISKNKFNTTDVYYLESSRSNEMNDKKEHKKLQSTFNAKIVNKVLLLKEYLLNKVRSI